jgi:hypothetical protein
MQRRVLNLGELNTTQIERWQRSIEVIEQEGQSRQYRLFTDREGAARACRYVGRGSLEPAGWAAGCGRN